MAYFPKDDRGPFSITDIEFLLLVEPPSRAIHLTQPTSLKNIP